MCSGNSDATLKLLWLVSSHFISRYNVASFVFVYIPLFHCRINVLITFSTTLIFYASYPFFFYHDPLLRNSVMFPPIQWVLGALYPGIKRPGREADHLPPSSSEV